MCSVIAFFLVQVLSSYYLQLLGWMIKKNRSRNLFSRLEECEKNLDRGEEIQKLLHSRLERCEKNHELKE